MAPVPQRMPLRTADEEPSSREWTCGAFHSAAAGQSCGCQTTGASDIHPTHSGSSATPLAHAVAYDSLSVALPLPLKCAFKLSRGGLLGRRAPYSNAR